MASQIPGPTQPSPAEQKWIEEHGHEQLDQLNEMERGQDNTTWATNALYSATTGVLVVASVAALSHPRWPIVEIIMGILGAFISTVWFLILLRAHRYEIEYLLRSRWLQIFYKVPPLGAVWQEPKTMPKSVCHGISSFTVLRIYVSGLYLAWVVVIMLSVFLSFGNAGDEVTGDDEIWRNFAATFVASVALCNYYLFFWRQFAYVVCYLESIKKTLGLV